MSARSAVKGPTRAALQAQCEVPPVKDDQSLRSYFSAVRQMSLQGETYYSEGDLLSAYVYFKRFLLYAFHMMPKHKKYTRDVFANDRLWLKRERERVLPILEAISVQLDDEDERVEREAATNATAAATAESRASSGGGYDFGGNTAGYSLDDLPEAPTGHPSLTPAGGYGPTAAAVTAAAAAAYHPHASAMMPPFYPPPTAREAGSNAPSAPPYPSGGGNFYNGYAGVGGTALQDAFSSLSVDQSVSTSGYYPSIPPPKSQKQERPPIPQAGSQNQERPPAQRRTCSFGAERKVVLPSTLVSEFEKIARPNTDRYPYGIETCGILAGRLTHDVLEMTTLIIPKQKGTSDSVETTDETQLFNYMLHNKLITLGWIHTHPKQECFMSSVDVHTHCGYQLMLPEAVAVVYAPCDNKKRVGVFRLTRPDGMKLIQECELKGFHQHPDNIKIYEQADLSWAPVRMTIADLR